MVRFVRKPLEFCLITLTTGYSHVSTRATMQKPAGACEVHKRFRVSLESSPAVLSPAFSTNPPTFNIISEKAKNVYLCVRTLGAHA
jgi:hypothetical protein